MNLSEKNLHQPGLSYGNNATDSPILSMKQKENKMTIKINEISKEEAENSINSSRGKYKKLYDAILKCKNGLKITFDNRQDAVNFRYSLISKEKGKAKFPKIKTSVRLNIVIILILSR